MLNVKFINPRRITLYILYLKFKAYLVTRQDKIKIVGSICALLLIVCVALMISFKAKILLNDKVQLYTLIGFAWSAMAFIILGSLSNIKLKNLQKKILCNHLSTDFKECNDLIQLIIERSRVDGCCKFEYEDQLMIIGMYDDIDEPFVTLDDMNKTFPNHEEVNRFMIYPNEHTGTYPFLKEFLVKIVEKREDYVRLEKIAFQMWG